MPNDPLAYFPGCELDLAKAISSEVATLIAALQTLKDRVDRLESGA